MLEIAGRGYINIEVYVGSQLESPSIVFPTTTLLRCTRVTIVQKSDFESKWWPDVLSTNSAIVPQVDK